MTDAPTTPDPIEMAMEAEASGRAPEGIAHGLLSDQRRLIRWQIASERAGVALKLLTGIAGLAVAAGLTAMAWRASQADGLVVQPVLVSQALADEGLSGPVLARQVLDRMATLDSQNGYFRAVQVSDSWSQATAIPIANTGVSLDDVDRTLRRWLGNQTSVTGEVFGSGETVTVVLRASAGQAVSVSGPTTDVAALTRQAAEALFAQVRPLQYGYGLARQGDLAGGRRYFETAARGAATPTEKALALSGMALVAQQEGRLVEAIAFNLEGDRVAPAAYRPHLSLAYAMMGLGHTEEALRRFELGAKKPPRPTANATSERQLQGVNALTADVTRGAYLAAYLRGEPLFDVQIRGYFSPDLRPEKARILAGLHEITAARAVIPRIYEGSANQERRDRFRANARVNVAAAEGDWATVVAGTADAADEGSAALLQRIRALAGLGRVAEARALAASFPRDCEPCLRGGAVAAEAAGDRATADRDWAEAARQAPSIPFANLEWGRAKLARGDRAGAIALFDAAHRQVPTFADPLEAWGEVLLVGGDAAGATAKFAEAAKFAPRWGRLRLKWGEALAKLGQAAPAQTQWSAAAAMDLSADERAELQRVFR